MILRRIPVSAIIPLPLACLLAGCSSVQTHTMEQGDVTMTQEQFAAYVEHVFRYHNKVMNDLINVMADTEDPVDGNDALTHAEEQMDEACEPLNEVVSEEAVAQESSFWTRRQLPEAVPACEAATQHLEMLLHDLFKSRHKIDLNYGSEHGGQ